MITIIFYEFITITLNIILYSWNPPGAQDAAGRHGPPAPEPGRRGGPSLPYSTLSANSLK